MTTAFAGCVGKVRSFVGGESQLEEYKQRAREATAQYDGDWQAAVEDGFEPGGPYVPGMGWHFSHPGRIEAAIENGFSVDEPPMLTFDKEGNLGSVEYGGPSSQLSQSPDLFSEFDDADWSVHGEATHLMATPDDEVADPAEMSLDELLTPDHWMEFAPPDRSIEPGDTVEKDFTGDGEPEERVVDITFTHDSLVTLHFWVHEENPEGVFAPSNPNFAQG